MKRKKKATVLPGKISSSGVWIAPDLERKIKGEGGRRGLSEPPYSYYLHLADLVLNPSASTSKASLASDTLPGPDLPVLVHRKPPKLLLPKPPKSPINPKPAKRPASKPLQSPALKKLSLPKPPKRGR